MSIPISFTRKQPRKAEFFFEQEAAVDRLEEFLKCSSEHRVSRALRAKSLNFHTGHWKRSAGSITHWFFFFFCTFECGSVSASKYRLRSNGRNIVKGINTRNIGCSEFKLISVPSEEVTSKPFFSSLKKTASQFHSSALPFFFLFSFSCGYGYLLNSENAVTHN